eukprot:COSAG06_NODE_562_length_14275_cov_28.599041_22_plen_80_part_01
MQPGYSSQRTPCYGRVVGVARSRRRQAGTAGKASGPGDQARPRGLNWFWRVTEKTVASRLPAALAYKLIRRGCSPADLAT